MHPKDMREATELAEDATKLGAGNSPPALSGPCRRDRHSAPAVSAGEQDDERARRRAGGLRPHSEASEEARDEPTSDEQVARQSRTQSQTLVSVYSPLFVPVYSRCRTTR